MTNVNLFYQKQKVAALAHAGDPREVMTKVAGVTFDNRPKVVEKLAVGDPLVLRREPADRYDANAIRVTTPSGEQAGYVPALLAARLAPVMDEHGGTLSAVVAGLTGDPAKGFTRGVNIRFTAPSDLPRVAESCEELDI